MQPKKMNKYLLSLAVASALTSTGLSAATANYSVGFTTVPDIGISQVTAMNFGSGLALTSGAVCTMAISDNAGTNYVGDVTMRLANIVDGDNTADATTADLSGAGCAASVGSKGTIGIYEIQGIAGGTVNITVNNVTAGGDFNYTAAGCVGTYDGAGNGDSCTAVTGGTPLSAVLASAADTVGNGAGEGNPTPGATRIALAGTITTTTTHTAGQLLTESFVIDVTY